MKNFPKYTYKHYVMITGTIQCIWFLCFCITSYDHPHILAGQGTMGLEIIEQVPDLDACIIPIGGAGLIAGAALAIKNLKPDVQIIVS